MIALIDADIITYQVAAADQKDYGGEVWVNTQASIDKACRTVEDWTSRAECDTPWLIFSPANRRNYRKSLNPVEYKADRSEKPVCYWEIADGLKARFQWFDIDGLEADDTMGILQTDPNVGDTTIVSIDKDMLTIPGMLFNPTKDAWPEEISPALATWNWLYQTVIGDSADGYKGAPGIGPKKAKQQLCTLKSVLSEPTNAESMIWDSVVEIFRAKVDDVDEADRLAVLNARLARILHREDLCKDSNTIRLWHPTDPERLCLESFDVVGGWHE